MIDLWNFEHEEFDCPCDVCISVMDDEFLKKIQVARTLAGIPFRITSGYRCPQHNQEVGGVSDSSHARGLGCDISATSGAAKLTILKALLAAGFNRIGVYPRHIHADIDSSKPQEVAWVGG